MNRWLWFFSILDHSATTKAADSGNTTGNSADNADDVFLPMPRPVRSSADEAKLQTLKEMFVSAASRSPKSAKLKFLEEEVTYLPEIYEAEEAVEALAAGKSGSGVGSEEDKMDYEVAPAVGKEEGKEENVGKKKQKSKKEKAEKDHQVLEGGLGENFKFEERNGKRRMSFGRKLGQSADEDDEEEEGKKGESRDKKKKEEEEEKNEERERNRGALSPTAPEKAMKFFGVDACAGIPRGRGGRGERGASVGGGGGASGSAGSGGSAATTRQASTAVTTRQASTAASDPGSAAAAPKAGLAATTATTTTTMRETISTSAATEAGTKGRDGGAEVGTKLGVVDSVEGRKMELKETPTKERETGRPKSAKSRLLHAEAATAAVSFDMDLEDGKSRGGLRGVMGFDQWEDGRINYGRKEVAVG